MTHRDLTDLPHDLDTETRTCRAVIETPKGSRGKFTYQPDCGAFELSNLLPDGMSFPLDFGFVPSTRADDGDPIDVLVLADEPCPVGTLLTIRLIGVIEGEQTEDGQTLRNDRLLAVAVVSHLFAAIGSVEDLPDDLMVNLERFWLNYNALKGREFKVLAVRDGRQAAQAITQASRPRA